jgi:hypothetical protein
MPTGKALMERASLKNLNRTLGGVLPDSGHAVPRESGETKIGRRRRNHTPAFKIHREVDGDRTLAE